MRHRLFLAGDYGSMLNEHVQETENNSPIILLEKEPKEPLSLESTAEDTEEDEEEEENENEAAEMLAMINRTNSKHNNHENTANTSRKELEIISLNASSPSRGGRSLDNFLEDAYHEHSACTFQCLQWKYWLIMLSLGISNSSDASEILCLSYILSNNTFQDLMLLDSSWRGGMLAAAVFAGMLMGGLVVGTLADWKGRRPMLIFGLLLNMTAGILSACAPNVFVLTGLRMIAGVGIGATVPPLFTLVTELAPPSKRGFFVTFCASFWMVGSIFVALMAILFLKKEDKDAMNDLENNNNNSPSTSSLFAAWRIFALACAIPSALGAVMVHWLVPESPRFLALQRRFDEAVASANVLASALHYHGPDLHRWEIEEQFGQACQSSFAYHPTTPSLESIEDGASWSILRWIQLALADFFVSSRKLYTPSMKQTTWPLQMVWFSLSFGSYGLMTWINTLFFAVHLEDVYYNALLFALSNLPGNIFTAFCLDRVGRAQMLVGSILSASMSLLSFAAFANMSDGTHPPSTYGVVLSACSFQCFTTAAWNTIDVMTSEQFPTTVRSTGMGVCAASGRVGAMLAQFINGYLVGRPVRLLVVASVTLAMGAMTPFLLPQRGDMTGQPVHDDFQAATSVEMRGRLGDENSDHDDSNNTPDVCDGTTESSTIPNITGLSRRGNNPPTTGLGCYHSVPKESVTIV